jgi:hypothetical protein
MNKQIDYFKHCKFILVLIVLVFSFVALPAVAAEQGYEKEPILKNIGFIDNPSKELKEKYPMCDAFLKVEWIDKEKKIGYSRYDIYRDGKKEKQNAFALIHLDDTRPHFDYDLSVSEFEGVGKISTKDVFSIIKKGKVFFNTNYLNIVFDNGEKRLDFDTIACTPQTCNFTLADQKINVCIPLPGQPENVDCRG